MEQYGIPLMLMECEMNQTYVSPFVYEHIITMNHGHIVSINV